MLWNLPKITTFSCEVIFLFHKNFVLIRNNDIDSAKCSLFYLLLFYILSFLILYRSFLKSYRSFLKSYPWFYDFISGDNLNVYILYIFKYMRYWYGLPLRMSYIMGICKRYPYYLFSGHSISFSSMAFWAVL